MPSQSLDHPGSVRRKPIQQAWETARSRGQEEEAGDRDIIARGQIIKNETQEFRAVPPQPRAVVDGLPAHVVGNAGTGTPGRLRTAGASVVKAGRDTSVEGRVTVGLVPPRPL